MDSTPGGWLVKQNPGVEITWLPESAREFQVAVGMRRDDRVLRETVDRALQRLIEQGRIEEILVRYGIPMRPAWAGAASR